MEHIGHDLFMKYSIFISEFWSDVEIRNHLSIVELFNRLIDLRDFLAKCFDFFVFWIFSSWKHSEQQDLRLWQFLTYGFNNLGDAVGNVLCFMMPSVVGSDHDHCGFWLDRSVEIPILQTPEHMLSLISTDP